MKTIILTGMSGVGKSTAAALLAEKINLLFLDTDKKIEATEKMTISDIFLQKGEQYFRELERKLIKNIPLENAVIALGGGAFEDETTRKFLLENCFVIYLEAAPKTILSRIKDDTSRPLLCNKMTTDTISDMIKKRKTNYEKADKTVNTDNKSIENVVKELYDICKH